MSVLTFTSYRPSPRYDAEAWAQARIEQATSKTGPWTAVETFTLTPVDADPTQPASRSFTTELALDASTWFRIVFIDGTGDTETTTAIPRTPVPGGIISFDEQVARLRSPEGGGFSISPERTGKVLNQAIRRIAVRSRCLIEERELGPGVADQFLYDLDPDVVEVLKLMVNGDPKYGRISTVQHWELLAADAVLPAGRTGAFAPRFTADGAKKVAVHPTPAAGDAITALCSVSTPDYAGSDVPPLPADLEDAVQWAAKAILYEEVDEDANSAQIYAAKADQAAAELREREITRVGSGAIQGQIYRVNFQ